MRKWVMAAMLAGVAASAGAQSFSADRVKADATFLASDLMEGRNAGTRGYDMAAAFVASRFEALGLKPGNGASYYQPITFVQSKMRTDVPSGLTINGTLFRNGQEMVMTGNPLHGAVDRPVEAVFVGYGLEDKRYGFDDYAGLDVRGKVLVVLGSPPGGAPSEVVASLLDRRADVAAAKGALGIISLTDPRRLQQVGWEKFLEYGSVSRLRWVHPDGRPEVFNPTLSVGGALGPKAADALFAGAPKSAAQVLAEAASPTARPKGFALPAKLRYQRMSSNDMSRSANVVGFLPGSDPRLANEVVVYSAHLDHDGIVKPVKGDAIMNGLMDNAMGVSTMLEAARAFVDSGKAPRRSILFAAVTAEEDGLLGSDYLANYPVLAGRKVVANVNLDMPVITYDFQDVIAFGADQSTLGPMVAAAAASMGLKSSPDPMPEEGLFTRSDHYSWVQKGVPAVFLATGWAGPGKAAFQDFLAKHYHQVSDDASLPIDWSAGAKFARLNYLIGRQVADAAEAPRWYKGSFFGNKFAPAAPKAPDPR